MPPRIVHRAVLSSVALALLFGAATLMAQTQDEWRASEEAAAASPVEVVQGYHGVKPGGGNTLPRVEELRGKPGTWVTWPGFMMLPGGGSRVFLQTTGRLQYTSESGKKRIVVKLGEAQVFLWNNKNPLITAFFNTPLKKAYLKKRRSGAELVMEMKVEATPMISQVSDGDGYHYMFLDFAPGTYPVEGGASPRPSFVGYGGGSETPLEGADEVPPDPRSSE